MTGSATAPVSIPVGAARPETTARGSYPKGDRRRALIIQIAFETFASGGYRNASMSQIAATCGVTRAGLLHHFPTKEALLEAVLAERDRRMAEEVFSGARPETEDGVDYFRRLVMVAEHNAHNPAIVSLFVVLSGEATDPAHPAHSYFVARYQRSLERTRAALGNLSDRGLLRSSARRPGVEADVIALMDGLQIQWLLNPTATDMPGLLRARLAEIVDADLG